MTMFYPHMLLHLPNPASRDRRLPAHCGDSILLQLIGDRSGLRLPAPSAARAMAPAGW
jgi:hypothetical protein